MRRLLLVCAVAVALFAVPSRAQSPEDLCAKAKSGENCSPGNNRQTQGGGEKVPHTGWPKISGVFFVVKTNTAHSFTGGPDNDELLGLNGSDKLDGGAGSDVIWGDYLPAPNGPSQRDTLIGGDGNDFIYPSHGTTVVRAGSGNDTVYAYYGKGTIDCGPGSKDSARIRENGAFKTKNCEKILHFCSYGSNPDGSCKKPHRDGAVSRRR